MQFQTFFIVIREYISSNTAKFHIFLKWFAESLLRMLSAKDPMPRAVGLALGGDFFFFYRN